MYRIIILEVFFSQAFFSLRRFKKYLSYSEIILCYILVNQSDEKYIFFGTENKRKGDDGQENPVAKTKRVEGGAKSSTDLIVLGLPWKCTEDDMRKYFSQFGELLLVQVMYQSGLLVCEIHYILMILQQYFTRSIILNLDWCRLCTNLNFMPFYLFLTPDSQSVFCAGVSLNIHSFMYQSGLLICEIHYILMILPSKYFTRSIILNLDW